VGTNTAQIATTAFVQNEFQLMQVQDQKANNVDGGSFTSGDWRKRDLNTVVYNSISGASLSSNEITLPAGTYLIEGYATANLVANHLTQIRDTSDSSVLIVGVNATSNTNLFNNALSNIKGKISLAATTTIELVHRCSSTKATTGFGYANDFGSTNVYSDLIIRKV